MCDCVDSIKEFSHLLKKMCSNGPTTNHSSTFLRPDGNKNKPAKAAGKDGSEGRCAYVWSRALAIPPDKCQAVIMLSSRTVTVRFDFGRTVSVRHHVYPRDWSASTKRPTPVPPPTCVLGCGQRRDPCTSDSDCASCKCKNNGACA